MRSNILYNTISLHNSQCKNVKKMLKNNFYSYTDAT